MEGEIDRAAICSDSHFKIDELMDRTDIRLRVTPG
jgi:hypothetical protein